MTATVTLSGVTYPILDKTLKITESVTQTSRADFTVYDSTGVVHFQFRQEVTITDSVLGLVFSGYVYDSTETNYYPQAAIKHVVTCTDQRDLMTKRVASGLNDDANMSNQYAGDNVVYLLANYLSQEGVTASYAMQQADNQTDFASGSLANVVAADNLGDGDLELASAGTSVTKTETTASDWAANVSSSGLDTSISGSLRLASHSALQLTGTAGLNFGNAFVYQEFWNAGAYVIQTGDYLTYKVWVNSSSPQIMCGIDFVCTDGTTMRDFASTSLVDQNGLLAHPKQDLSGFANDQWYYRQISISGMVGKVISFATIVFEGDNQGLYTGYVSDVIIYASNLTTHNLNLYYSSGSHASVLALPANTQIGNNGYSNVSLQGVIAYEKTGTRIANTTLLTSAAIYQNSLISWVEGGLAANTTQVIANALPANTALAINTSIDSGATFQAAANFAAIPNLLPGASLVGRTLQTEQVLSITGKDPTATPVLNSLAWTVAPSYVATKHDVFKAYATQADFNTGTKTNVTSLTGGGINLTNSQRSWLGGSLANQTMWGNGTFSQSIYKGTLGITSTTGAQAFSEFSFAGNWGGGSDFTASMDIQITSASEWSGFTYMTTSFTNLVNSFAYRADVNLSSINLSRAGNGATATPTTLGGSPVAVSLTAGDWHTLTVKYTASTHTHTLYLDGTQYISVVDATYTAAGQFAACFNNSAGTTQTAYFQNFGVMPPACISPATPLPQWLSPSIALSSITVGNSIVEWNATQPNGTIVNVLASVNGGAFVACTNGGVIPGLSAGTVLTNGTLQFQVQLQTPNAATTPVFTGLSAWILSSYSSSGSRISPGLSLNNVGRAGNTLVAWDGLVPSGCSLFVDTSFYKTNWTNVGSGIQGGVAIAGINGQPDLVEDSFDSDTSSYYTQTSQTNGSPATWTWGTTNVVASGGSTAFLLYSSLTASDVDMVTDMDTSDAGGLVWRVKDTSNFYDLVVCDASSTTPNQMVLYSVANNVRTTLATVSIVWPRLSGVPHRIRVTMLGPVITVYFDGTVITTYTDSHPLQGGQCGLRTDTVGGQSSANFYYFYLQPQGDSVLNKVVFCQQRLVSTDPTQTPQLQHLSVSVRSNDIQSGAFMPTVAYSVLNGSQNTIAQDVDDMAKQSTNFVARIDYSKKMKFQHRTGTLAPWVLSGEDLLVGKGVTVKRSGDQFRTQPWIQGGTDTVLQPAETFVTDGITQTFTTKYPVESIVSIATANGVKTYSVGVKGLDTGKDFYYQVGSTTINQDASAIPLPQGPNLTITYYGQIHVVATSYDPILIATQAALENNSGIIEVVEVAQGLDRPAAQQLASSRRVEYGVGSLVLSCTTTRAGLAVGQFLSVFLSQHAIQDEQVLITDMVTSWQQDMTRGVLDHTPYFTITATSGPTKSGWQTTLSGMGR